MIGRTNTGGSGGGGLNFKLVGNPKPSNPKGCIIWIDTDEPITSYVFSATQPIGSKGMVWISTGTTSNVEFNALKKNNLTVYPMTAKQYIDDVWVNKEAMTHQDEGWVSWWNGELYSPGNEYPMVTGGWVAVPMGRMASSTGTAMPTVTQDAAGMAMKCESGGVVRTVNKIDLTEYSKLYFTGDLRTSGSRDDWMRLCVWSEMGKYWTDNIAAQLSSGNTDYGTQFINLEGVDGEHYVGFAMHASGCLMELLWLE